MSPINKQELEKVLYLLLIEIIVSFQLNHVELRIQAVWLYDLTLRRIDYSGTSISGERVTEIFEYLPNSPGIICAKKGVIL